MMEGIVSAAGVRKTSLSSVPAFPPVAAQLLRALSGEDASVAEVVRLISSDAALSAQILQQANSPLYGARSPIVTVRGAVVMLGLGRVKSIALTLVTGNYLRRALRFVELRGCWRHTMACALLAEKLAGYCGMAEGVAYTAGLLHDIGRLGLLAAAPERYAEMLRASAIQCLDILDYERERFGADHAEAGRLLIEEWKLPAEFAVIAGRHHDPPDGSEFDLLALVHVACRMADTLGFEVVPPTRPASFDELRAMLPPGARDRFTVTAEQLQAEIAEQIVAHAPGA